MMKKEKVLKKLEYKHIRYFVLALIVIVISMKLLRVENTNFAINAPPAQSEFKYIPPPVLERDKNFNQQGAETKKVSQKWMEKIHKAAPGDDWKIIEASSIRQLIEKKKYLSKTSLSGSWIERGPSNIPGRITDIKIDYEDNSIYAISDHGIIFHSSDLNGGGWQALNDQNPLGLGVASQLLVFHSSPNKIVSSGYIKVDNNWGIYFSSDNGLTWNTSGGIGEYPIMGIRRMMNQGEDVYVLIQEYNATFPTDYYTVYKSENSGASFYPLYRSVIPIGDGGRHIKSDMWVSNDITELNFYLALEDSLFFVNKLSGTRIFKGLITGQSLNQCLLTGLSKNGSTELTAYIAVNDIGKFYAWNSTNQNWQFKGQLSDWWLSLPFGSNSFSCSPLSADTLYFGSILTSRSYDRGITWTTIDLDSTGSYALYHGDVPKTLSVINNSSELETYMGTDGGIYKLDIPTEHFNSISIPGLNSTQIYKMVSMQSDPGKMFIGTQDNGYCFTLLGNIQLQEVDFTFQWGGDVTNVASGDGGETFWLWWLGDGCNYMTGPDENYVSSTWSPYWQNGSVPYWEPPVWISNHFPDRCYTAGSLNNLSGNYLIKVQAIPGSDAVGILFPYNFEAQSGGKISAIAISPIDSNYFYVATENGYFLRSTDGGQFWSKVLLSPTMYPRTIYPSKINLGKVWVGGSGYSNSPVFHSTDNGQTFSTLNNGMPSCLVEAFATNDDETVLFAATSIGPFIYESGTMIWGDLSGFDAPLVHYTDVEFLSSSQTARFATYARGVWDYHSIITNVSEKDLSDFSYSVFPNPFNPTTNIHFSIPEESKVTIEIFNSLGERISIVVSEVLTKGTYNYNWNGNKFSSGIYFIRLLAKSTNGQKFVQTNKVVLLK